MRVLPWVLLLVVVGGAAWWWLGMRTPPAGSTAQAPTREAQAPTTSTASKAARAGAPTSPARRPALADRSARMAEGMPQPDYPREALRAREGGTVLLNVEVDPQGEPSQISIAKRSGHRQLDRAAMTAASKWQFEPAIQDGEPVTATVQIPVEFSPE